MERVLREYFKHANPLIDSIKIKRRGDVKKTNYTISERDQKVC